MVPKDDFDFLNSEVFLKYTQASYRTPEEIYFRLKNKKLISIKDWPELESKIITSRKSNAIVFDIKLIDKKFWFYPADCILKKAHEIEKLGAQLFDTIQLQTAFEKEFLLDATIEESITSAIYEGANSTRAKAQMLIESGNIPKNKDEWMLVNNYNAMLWIKNNSSRHISAKMIEEIHQIVTQNTLSGDDANFSGKFRDDKVFVLSGSEVKHEGIDHKKIVGAINEVIELVAENNRYFPQILKGILLHYFISYIHPFFDGNGRAARTLFYTKAVKNNLRFVEILSVSAYLKNHGKQYEKSFEKVVRNELDMTYFIDFNLDALKAALEKVQSKIDYILKINLFREKFKINEQQIGLLQKLALHKFRSYDILSYAESIGKSREIARQELKQLVDIGLLTETQSGKKFIYTINKLKLDQLQKGSS